MTDRQPPSRGRNNAGGSAGRGRPQGSRGSGSARAARDHAAAVVPVVTAAAAGPAERPGAAVRARLTPHRLIIAGAARVPDVQHAATRRRRAIRAAAVGRARRAGRPLGAKMVRRRIATTAIGPTEIDTTAIGARKRVVPRERRVLSATAAVRNATNGPTGRPAAPARPDPVRATAIVRPVHGAHPRGAVAPAALVAAHATAPSTRAAATQGQGARTPVPVSGGPTSDRRRARNPPDARRATVPRRGPPGPAGARRCQPARPRRAGRAAFTEQTDGRCRRRAIWSPPVRRSTTIRRRRCAMRGRPGRGPRVWPWSARRSAGRLPRGGVGGGAYGAPYRSAYLRRSAQSRR